MSNDLSIVREPDGDKPRSLADRVLILEQWRESYERERLPERMDSTEKRDERLFGMYLAGTVFFGLVCVVVGWFLHP